MFTRTKQGAVDVIAGTDPLNVDYVDDAAGVIDDCLSSGPARIVVDMRQIPLLDSAGLELLLSLHDRCVERGGMLHLAGPSPLCRDILEVTGVISHFDVFSDPVDAAGSFAQ
ncbi:MAG: hypothetical protein B7Z55_00720 [Planctomycetales bacterium 12-60-4]|nr:MAG: hypothetical protein B7Z55_00720 [Planctomycetales bacterium 12-60-4]